LYKIFNEDCCPHIDKFKLNSLSWADDLVLLSSSPEGLQNSLNKLNDYCKKWGLVVNGNKTKAMIFGHGKLTNLMYENMKISQVQDYTYLGVKLHQSCKTKYAIEDRIERTSRAINMLQGVLYSNGNINVNVALSIFDKQIIPILTYGSTFWGMQDNYTKLYVKDIPEDINTLDGIRSELNNKSIIYFKRVGRKSDSPRNVILTMNSFEAKNFLLYNNKATSDIQSSCYDSTFEKVQTNFCKFVLNISKFASNHAIRAELGRYPLSVQTNLTMIKYWYRLENLNDNSLLSSCFKVCKNNNHEWYLNIKNFLNKNGLGYITDNCNQVSINSIINNLKKALEDQYIQQWDNRARNCDKLNMLYKFKKNSYKKSTYLETIADIEVRKKITKLRLGCSNLNSHRFYSVNNSNKCIYCEDSIENVEHFLLDCKEYAPIRNEFMLNINKDFVLFKDFSKDNKILSILSLKLPLCVKDMDSKFQKLCISYINNLFCKRFKKS